MKDDIRLFVAAPIPAGIKQTLLSGLTAFTHPTIRTVPESNLHLTLYFIGNVPQEQLPGIKEKVAAIAREHAPFTLSFVCTEPGPSTRSPRLVWARFGQNTFFETLQLNLTHTLSVQPSDKRKPIPHVTLARFRKDKAPVPQLHAVTPPEPLLLHVPAIALWQSELATPHPVYRILETWPLSQNPGPAKEV